MSIRNLLYMVIIPLVLGGCVFELPFTGRLPSGARLDMRGKLSLSQEGQLELVLDEPCMATMNDVCDARTLGEISVIAMTPWGKEIHGVWVDAQHVKFPVNWKHDGVDLLAPDAVTLATSSWKISGAQWTPNKRQARQILSLSAARNDLDEAEGELDRGGEQSNLEVRFEVDEGT